LDARLWSLWRSRRWVVVSGERVRECHAGQLSRARRLSGVGPRCGAVAVSEVNGPSLELHRSAPLQSSRHGVKPRVRTVGEATELWRRAARNDNGLGCMGPDVVGRGVANQRRSDHPVRGIGKAHTTSQLHRSRCNRPVVCVRLHGCLMPTAGWCVLSATAGNASLARMGRHRCERHRSRAMLPLGHSRCGLVLF
jgi:hypothetical protein